MSGFTVVATSLTPRTTTQHLWSSKRPSMIDSITSDDMQSQHRGSNQASMKISITDLPRAPNASQVSKHHNSPRNQYSSNVTESAIGGRQNLSLPQANIGSDLLRGSELAIARQYTQQSHRNPAPNLVGPFNETRGIRKQTDWSKHSVQRNMPGNEAHYQLYMRRLQQRQIRDEVTQSKRVSSSVQRIKPDKKRSQTAPVMKNNQTNSPQLCTLNEVWDINAGKSVTKSPLDISVRKEEFRNELAFKQEQNRHLRIRSSVTPRSDEGLLDWLHRSVTAVPLDSKFAARNTSRLFSLSVHGLQNRLADKHLMPNQNDAEEQRAVTAALGAIREQKREIKSAAGRINMNPAETSDERIETSRRLWSSHHCSRYASRMTMPQVAGDELAFDSGVIREFDTPAPEEESECSELNMEYDKENITDCLTPCPTMPRQNTPQSQPIICDS